MAKKVEEIRGLKFKKEVKHAMTGGTPQTKVKMTFTFLDEQAQVVQEALNMAKELMGLDYDDLALEYVLVEWMGNHDPSKANKIKAKLKGEIEEPEAEVVDEDEEPVKKPRKQRADKDKKSPVVEAEEEEEDEDEDDEDEDEDADDVEDEDEDDDEDEDEDYGI